MSKKILNNNRGIAGLAIGVSLMSAAALTNLPGDSPDAGQAASYIVQGASLAGVTAASRIAGDATRPSARRPMHYHVAPAPDWALHTSIRRSEGWILFAMETPPTANTSPCTTDIPAVQSEQELQIPPYLRNAY